MDDLNHIHMKVIDEEHQYDEVEYIIENFYSFVYDYIGDYLHN